MSAFVPTEDGGWLNLDRVAHIREQHGGYYTIVVTNEDGDAEEVLVQTERLDHAIEEAKAKYIPAERGWEVVYHMGDGKKYLAEPILAWRLPGMEAVTPRGVHGRGGGDQKIIAPWGAVFGDPNECTECWKNWAEFEAECRRYPDLSFTGTVRAKARGNA